MILATHAVVGGALGLLLRDNPAGAIFAAFTSHFLLDAIPHWHYQLRAKERDAGMPFGYRLRFDRDLIRDIVTTGMDCAVGTAIPLAAGALVAPTYLWVIFWGAAASVLPDFTQFLYYAFPRSPLRHLQRFHYAIHAKTRLDHKPLVGIPAQIALAAIFLALMLAA